LSFGGFSCIGQTAEKGTEYLTFQELLLENPSYILSINNYKPLTYNDEKFSLTGHLTSSADNAVLYLKTDKGEGRVCIHSRLKEKVKLIPNTGVYCKYIIYKDAYNPATILFYKDKYNNIDKTITHNTRKENKMFNLINIILMILITLIVPRVTFKLIFVPLKKFIYRAIKEWKES